MSKSKDNNHFVSEFQLKKFLCEKPLNKPGKYFVWVYESNGSATQQNIKHAAASYQFYGNKDDTLENALSVAESKYGEVYRKILLSPNSISDFSEELSDLLWLFSFRTRALRERMKNSFGQLMGIAAQRFDTIEAENWLRKKAMEKIEEEIEKQLVGLNAFQRLCAREAPEIIRLKLEAINLLNKSLRSGELQEKMSFLFDCVGNIARNTNSIDDSHNNSLIKFIESGGKCPVRMKPDSWSYVNSEKGEFVLGDCGAFTFSNTGEFLPLIGIDENVSEVYLPISSNLTAVGSYEGKLPQLNNIQIVMGAITTSYEHFYASYFSPEIEKTARQIMAIKSGMIGSKKIEEIIGGLFDSI